MPNRDDVKAVMCIRSRPTRRILRKGHPARADARLKGSTSGGGDQFTSRWTPSPRAYHDETLPPTRRSPASARWDRSSARWS